MKRNTTLNSMTHKCVIIFRNYLSLKIIKNRILKHVQYNPIFIKLFLITNYLSTHLYIFTENCLNICLMSKTVFFLRAMLLHGVLFFSFRVIRIIILYSNQLKYPTSDISNMASLWIHKSKGEKQIQRKTLVLHQQEYQRLNKIISLKITTFILQQISSLLYSI